MINGYDKVLNSKKGPSEAQEGITSLFSALKGTACYI